MILRCATLVLGGGGGGEIGANHGNTECMSSKLLLMCPEVTISIYMIFIMLY